MVLRVIADELHVANKPLHDLQAFAIEFDGPFRVCGGLFGLEVVGNGAEQFDGRIARGKLALPWRPGSLPFRAASPPASSLSRVLNLLRTTDGAAARR